LININDIELGSVNIFFRCYTTEYEIFILRQNYVKFQREEKIALLIKNEAGEFIIKNRISDKYKIELYNKAVNIYLEMKNENKVEIELPNNIILKKIKYEKEI